MSLWDEVKQNLSEWYTVAADKTSEVAKIQSRRYDKFGLSRDVERQFSELGSMVYNGLQEGRADLLDDPALTALVGRIRALEEDLRHKDEEIARIRREHAERKSGPKEAAAAAGGADADGGDEPEMPRVITDPVLDEGDGESAILVEPGEDAGGDPDQDEHDPGFRG
ncbi:MAG: hypothetical protein ABR506_04190 [Candidatus Krumholzibacteriia bacterium]